MTRSTVSEISRPPIFPSRRLGQNFLTDSRIVDRIIEALAPTQEETILEIGPGTGALTESLVEKTHRLVAVEFDRNLADFLRQRFESHHNFRLIEADALRLDFCAEIRPAQQARLVANLPYNISTAILQRLFAQRGCIPEMVLMLQREVVDRLVAPPGSSDRGYISVLAEAYAEIERLFDVPPTCFRPAPKVWSSVVRLRMRGSAVSGSRDELLQEIISAGFAQRRKTILNNLRQAPGKLKDRVNRHGGASIVLCRAEVNVQRRAQTLTLAEWQRLASVIEPG